MRSRRLPIVSLLVAIACSLASAALAASAASAAPASVAWRISDVPHSRGAESLLLVAAPNGRALVVWSHKSHLLAAVDPPGGARFGSPEAIAKIPFPEEAMVAAAIDDSGEAMIAWELESGVRAVRIGPHGGRRAARLSPVGMPLEGEAPSVALSARGAAAVTWEDEEDLDYLNYAAPRANFGPPRRLEAAVGASAGFDARGTLEVDWQRESGELETISRALHGRWHRALTADLPSRSGEAAPSIGDVITLPSGSQLAEVSPERGPSYLVSLDRGRFGRSWKVPPGNEASLVLAPTGWALCAVRQDKHRLLSARSPHGAFGPLRQSPAVGSETFAPAIGSDGDSVLAWLADGEVRAAVGKGSTLGKASTIGRLRERGEFADEVAADGKTFVLVMTTKAIEVAVERR